MLRKPQEEAPKQPGNRITIPEESGIRSIAGFKEFLAMVEDSKGSQIELSWKTKTPGQRFVLDMQWDINQKAPYWTLYEVIDGKSTRLWNEQFTISNVDMCYDILVMACGGVDPSTKNLAEILKTQPVKEDYSKGLGKSLFKASAEAETEPGKVPLKEEDAKVANKALFKTPAELEKEVTAETADDNNLQVDTVESKPVSADVNTIQNNNSSANVNQNPGMLPGYMYPPGMGMPTAMGFPMFAYTPSPGVVIPANAPVQAPLYSPNAPDMPTNAWPYGSSGGTGMYGQPNMPGMPMQNKSTEGALSNLPVDSSLFNKQKDISLVNLLVKAELMTEQTLAAALKIQELVHEERLEWEKATDILKRLHNKGDSIESYLVASDYLDNTATKGRRAKKLFQNEEDVAALALLEQAGLISQNDIKSAETVVKKHGGDIAAVLQAAQKLNQKTFEAAKICGDLKKKDLMKVEQVVIILNYCSRSRGTFEDALNELKWPDPRK